ncbi:epithelial chloride channel protein-like protein, partial [Dinothrombium tinctorium]
MYLISTIAFLFLYQSNFIISNEIEQLYDVDRNCAVRGVQFRTWLKNFNEIEIGRIADHSPKKVRVYIHGHLTQRVGSDIRDATFKCSPAIDAIVLANWTTAKALPRYNYDTIRMNVEFASKCVAVKLYLLDRNGTIDYELVGHGMGAHIAGMTARIFKIHSKRVIKAITGLDPVGRVFNDHKSLSLQCTDSRVVSVIHTNTAVYGSKHKICENDLYPNGGERQPDCENVLERDICSHRKARQIYIEKLCDDEPKNVVDHKKILPRFVLCIDISGSMKGERIKMAKKAAVDLISQLPSNFHLGISTFGTYSQQVYPLTELVNEENRKQLILAVSQLSAEGWTNIGAGLRESREMLLKSLNIEGCTTIILLSDGEDNYNPLATKREVEKLKAKCIRIVGVAIGKEAASILEEIAAQTEGSVFDVESTENVELFAKFRRSLFDSVEVNLKPDERPINLPEKIVALESEETKSIAYFIDTSVGVNTSFSAISGNWDKLNAILTSPSNSSYTLRDPINIYGFQQLEKRMDIDRAEAGKWTITLHNVAPDSYRKRRDLSKNLAALISVRTFPKDNKNKEAIRLDARLSNHTLEYPNQIFVFAELRMGHYPIIKANVYATVENLNQTISLYDNGAFPDQYADDGIYAASILKLNRVGRHSVKVTARNDNETKIVFNSINYLDESWNNCSTVNCNASGNFERETNVGSLKLLSYEGQQLIPINSVNDLRVIASGEKKRQVTLVWTVPGSLAFNIYPTHFDLRVFTNGTDFEKQFKIDENHIVSGTYDYSGSLPEASKKITIQMPKKVWDAGYVSDGNQPYFKLAFALKSYRNETSSAISNLANVILLKSENSQNSNSN